MMECRDKAFPHVPLATGMTKQERAREALANMIKQGAEFTVYDIPGRDEVSDQTIYGAIREAKEEGTLEVVGTKSGPKGKPIQVFRAKVGKGKVRRVKPEPEIEADAAEDFAEEPPRPLLDPRVARLSDILTELDQVEIELERVNKLIARRDELVQERNAILDGLRGVTPAVEPTLPAKEPHGPSESEKKVSNGAESNDSHSW